MCACVCKEDQRARGRELKGRARDEKYGCTVVKKETKGLPFLTVVTYYYLYAVSGE